jgi:hypothetical protein
LPWALNSFPFSGLTTRDFKGFHNLNEVECTGRGLKPEVKLIALQMYILPDRKLVASMNVISKECVTLGKYSSCRVNDTHNHESKLRLLVDDLKEESKAFECKANTFDSLGSTKEFSWSLVIRLLSKFAVGACM